MHYKRVTILNNNTWTTDTPFQVCAWNGSCRYLHTHFTIFTFSARYQM